MGLVNEKDKDEYKYKQNYKEKDKKKDMLNEHCSSSCGERRVLCGTTEWFHYFLAQPASHCSLLLEILLLNIIAAAAK